MATYVVGDIQGCLRCLEGLLDKVGFSPRHDELWAVGDLINRGPQSLETLRFCMGLGSRFRTVLGNHDLHLLAVAHGYRSPNTKDTLQDVLTAPDRHRIFEWLRHQPLLFTTRGYTLVHAGIPPQWSITEAKEHAQEVESILHSEQPGRLFSIMYGNQPDLWQETVSPPERWRLITNYLTRMRFCTSDGRLELATKQGATSAPPGFRPWFAHPDRVAADNPILFGHWAALGGIAGVRNVIPLDTGCVWGGRLRAYNIEQGGFTHFDCSQS